MAAIEPLVELFLELGITSPEAESLLRGLFAHQARNWLKRHGEAEPSDVHVALVTGIHRNFISRLLAEPPKVAAARARKGHRSSRLLHTWHSDPLYQDNSGKPRDLPLRGPAPSFEALAARCIPGAAPRIALQELQRAGVLHLLADQRVRVHSRTMRASGINGSSISGIGQLGKALLETLVHNLRAGTQDRRLCESTPFIEVDEARLAVVQEVINRRATAFLQSLEAELAAERRQPSMTRRGKKVQVALTVFEAKKQEVRRTNRRGGGYEGEE
jgi:hypothetical protein